MDNKTIEELKEKLLKEKESLEQQLASLGHINPDNPKDWEVDPGDAANDSVTGRDIDPNVKADNFEETENRSGVLNLLETQLNDVLDALKKIEDGTYGICEKTGKKISIERLTANPSARTCRDHMND